MGKSHKPAPPRHRW